MRRQSLRLDWEAAPGLDDKGVGHVVALQRLRSLDLSQTRVTDAGLEASFHGSQNSIP